MQAPPETAALAPPPAPEETPFWPDAMSRWLDELLKAFVALHTGNRQRGASWYQLMGSTVGGSELSALLGSSPYRSFYDVVAEKAAAASGSAAAFSGGGPACWWGSLFEGVIELVVAVDLGAPLRGTEICIQAAPGHRTSPDGYLVVRVLPGEAPEEAPRLWTTDEECPEAYTPRVALVEFKCPYSRRPNGAVPANYRPQVWSGLAVSPVAHFGLFIDSVFRKCSLEALGPSPDFDREYHRAASDTVGWGAPLAWGLVAVYAPKLSAPLGVRMGWKGAAWAPGDPSPDSPDADLSLVAWQVLAACLGAISRGGDASGETIDLGDCPPKVFDRVLGLVDRGRFPSRLGPPCFADGRGSPLHCDRDLGAEIARLRREAPSGHWLLGLLPWKLFTVDYVPVARKPGFLEEIAPLVDEVHSAAAAAVASGDPEGWIRAARASDTSRKRARRERPEDTRGTFYGGDAEKQDLFDALWASAE